MERNLACPKCMSTNIGWTYSKWQPGECMGGLVGGVVLDGKPVEHPGIVLEPKTSGTLLCRCAACKHEWCEAPFEEALRGQPGFGESAGQPYFNKQQSEEVCDYEPIVDYIEEISSENILICAALICWGEALAERKKFAAMSLATSLLCSFCYKPSSKVAKVIAGPEVCICNECLGLSCKLIGEDMFAEAQRKR
jgi:hypothetical protein